MRFLPKTVEDVLSIDLERFKNLPTVGDKTVEELRNWQDANKPDD